MTINELGEKLKAERISQGKKLEDIMARTKLSRRSLEAIEDGDLAGLPEHVYTKGFIRAYAKVLGMPLDELMEEVDNIYGVTKDSGLPTENSVHAGMEDQYKPPPDLHRPPRLGKWIKRLVIVAVLVILAVIAWRYANDGVWPWQDHNATVSEHSPTPTNLSEQTQPGARTLPASPILNPTLPAPDNDLDRLAENHTAGTAQAQAPTAPDGRGQTDGQPAQPATAPAQPSPTVVQPVPATPAQPRASTPTPAVTQRPTPARTQPGSDPSGTAATSGRRASTTQTPTSRDQTRPAASSGGSIAPLEDYAPLHGRPMTINQPPSETRRERHPSGSGSLSPVLPAAPNQSSPGSVPRP